jgi:uncharacterized protein YndB with AHSA1/START domain
MSEPTKISVRVKAAVKEVHHALTDAGELRVWLAEHAEVELPHRYEFWGRHTPAGDAPHQRLLHADDTTLRFAWELEGHKTTAEFALQAEAPDSTVVTLTLTGLPEFHEMLAQKNVLGLLYTFWTASLANLVDHLEGRELTPKCDFTSEELRAQMLIDAEPHAVYDALTDPAKVTQWFGANIEAEVYVGGRWCMGPLEANAEAAKIVELAPDNKLSLQWPDGLVESWELEGSGGKTRLTFVQSGFDEGNAPYAAWMGSLGGTAQLRRYLEVDGWRPIWTRIQLEGVPDGLLTNQ